MPVHGLFWLYADSTFGNIGVAIKGTIQTLNCVMELSSNVGMSQRYPQQL